MDKTKVVIIDDKQLGIDSLSWELKRAFPELDVVKTFTNPLEGYVYLQSADIDLLFLDIEMPEMTGFELLEKLPKIEFAVIFATAYDDFALKAFKYSALDYLLKPIDPVELKQAIGKYKISAIKPSSEQLRIHQYAHNGNLPDKIIFATQESYEFINPQDIQYCEAYSNYTTLHFTVSKLVVSKTLKDVEAILTDYGFYRVHNSYLINPSHITRYLKTDGGTVVMDCGKGIPVSRGRKEEFLSRILK